MHEQTIIEPGTDLAVIKTLTPLQVFSPGAIDPLLDKIAAEVRTAPSDVSTASGRAAIASLAYKVARTKTALDTMGKELVAEWKAKSSAVDAERRRVRDRLDALRDEVRKPLDDFEAAEEARIAAHERALASIDALTNGLVSASSAEVQERIDQIVPLLNRDWQEFIRRAEVTADSAVAMLHPALAAAIKREEEAAELARLRAEQEEREREEAARRQREREIAIAAKAADDARIAAELRAREEAEAERRRVDAERAAAEREAARKVMEIEAARRAAEDRAAAAEERSMRQQAAAAEAARVEAEAAAQREADKQYRTSINRAALAALISAGLSEQAAKAAITAIASGAVPNVRMVY